MVQCRLCIWFVIHIFSALWLWVWGQLTHSDTVLIWPQWHKTYIKSFLIIFWVLYLPPQVLYVSSGTLSDLQSRMYNFYETDKCDWTFILICHRSRVFNLGLFAASLEWDVKVPDFPLGCLDRSIYFSCCSGISIYYGCNGCSSFQMSYYCPVMPVKWCLSKRKCCCYFGLETKKSILSKEDLKSYRLVSGLSFLSKLVERIVAAQIRSHMDSHDLFFPLDYKIITRIRKVDIKNTLHTVQVNLNWKRKKTILKIILMIFVTLSSQPIRWGTQQKLPCCASKMRFT